MYSIGKTLEEHRSIKSLSVNGSFATIPFCAQMIADIFNKPVGIRQKQTVLGLVAFLLVQPKWVFIKIWMKLQKELVCQRTI